MYIILFIVFLPFNLIICSEFITDMISIKKFVPNVDDLKSSFCFSIGCFDQELIYNTKNKKLSFYDPRHPIKLNLKVSILDDYKNLNEDTFLKIDDFSNQKVEQISFNPKVLTFIMIHGFNNDFQQVLSLIQNFNQVSKIQYIVLDWSDCAIHCSYEEAVASLKVISKIFSNFILQLKTKSKIDFAKTHLIGVDLSNHIIGLISENLKFLNEKFYKITAFNPIKFLFEDKKEKDKFDPKDAKFTEIIYFNENGDNLIEKSFTTLNVFVFNLNRSSSLKLNSNNNLDLEIRNYLPSTFLIKKKEDCLPIAFKSNTQKEFFDGKIYDNNSKLNFRLIGLWSNQINFDNKVYRNSSKYFSVQDLNQNQCVYHYQVQIQIGSIFRKSKVYGTLEIYIDNDQFELKNEFSSNNNYTKLYTGLKPIKDIKKIKAKWITSRNLWFISFNNAIHVEKITFNYLSHFEEELQKRYSSVFCLSNRGVNVIAHNQYIFLSKC